jgi:hypothetical protein
MSLPSGTDLGSLDYVYLGAPFYQVGANPSIQTWTLDYIYLGAPFWAITSTYNAIFFGTGF